MDSNTIEKKDSNPVIYKDQIELCKKNSQRVREYQSNQANWTLKNRNAVRKVRFIKARSKKLFGQYAWLGVDEEFFRENFIKSSVSYVDQELNFNQERFSLLIEEYKIDPKNFIQNFITPCFRSISTKAVFNHERCDELLNASKEERLHRQEREEQCKIYYNALDSFYPNHLKFELFKESFLKLASNNPLNNRLLSTKTIEEQFEIHYTSFCAINPNLSDAYIKEIAFGNFYYLLQIRPLS